MATEIIMDNAREKLKRAWRVLLFASCTLLPAACSFGEEFEAADCDEDGAGDVSYVSLDIVPTAGPDSRAGGPTGGEDGDGREPGQGYENDVTTVTAFVMADGAGINAPGTTPIEAVIQFYRLTQQDDASAPYSRAYRTEPLPVAIPDGTYSVLAVANGGDMAWATNAANLTLADVRDHIYKGAAWQESADGYGQFVMASADDATLTLSSNSADEPAMAEIGVERLAARVDYQKQGSYTCAEQAVFRGKVEIEGAVLVNNMTAGSYLFKRTADDAKGTVHLRYLGPETATDGVATNYVIDPWTARKTPDMGALPDELYGLRLDTFATSAEWAAVIGRGTPVTDVGSGNEWLRIGYTLENTADRTAEPRDYATGVVFRARFTPDKVTGSYTEGHTFFRWNGALYATCRDIMEAYWDADRVDRAESDVKACTTWDDLRAVADGLQAGDPTGYVSWLRACVDGHGNGNGDDLLGDASLYTWTSYMRTVCGYYIDEQGNVKIDAGGKNTRELLARHNVQTYRDATCYYTYWIRHGGSESSDATMKHAIVRNNIYKLSVDGVYDLGDDLPGETPLVVTVYVNNWTLLPEESLPM